MRIAVIGSGNIGGSLGRLWVTAGHEVFFSARDRTKTDALALGAGAGAGSGTPIEAAQFGEVALLAVPWTALGATLTPPLVRALDGKVVIDATNPYGPASIPYGRGQTSSEAVAVVLRNSSIVKAFNMMRATEMAAIADGRGHPNRFAVLHCSDSDGARAVAATLIIDSRFVPVDAGALANGRLFEPGAPPYDQRITADEASRTLTRLTVGEESS